MAWDSRCFDYGKLQVVHFLLYNCRYWLDEFKMDGFRFDGITSMLYTHHGLGTAFTSYADYFNEDVDEDALTYLTFMGNEFGHPEWIDFPRQGNDRSYHHARRQWRLVDDPNLKYRFLYHFDKAMILLAKQVKLLEYSNLRLLVEHSADKIIVFERAGLVFAFNFHPTRSYSDYPIMVNTGKYQLTLDSDAPEFGGHGRLTPNQEYLSRPNPSAPAGMEWISIYIPNRTVIVLQPLEGIGSQRSETA